MTISVVDLFAGPGGLSEGFSSLRDKKNLPIFNIVLSIESDKYAHETLSLRSFFRHFPKEEIPDLYYKYLKKELTLSDLFSQFSDEYKKVKNEAWNTTLGKEPAENVDMRINDAICNNKDWILIGGPPCQAYSIAGRSRAGGIDPEDERIYLYREYYRILAVHNPPVFVMENVKGLLSAEVEHSSIFSQILEDLKNPVAAYRSLNGLNEDCFKCPGYRIFSLVISPKKYCRDNTPFYKHGDFVIKAENYGVPQTRHRVILLGIRNDYINIIPLILNRKESVPLKHVLFDLPRLRSGLSKKKETPQNWKTEIKKFIKNGLLDTMDEKHAEIIRKVIKNIQSNKFDRGNEFIPYKKINIKYEPEWFIDKNLNGVCNHSTRAHIAQDLLRYLFVSSYGKRYKVSPKLKDFPKSLLPMHNNIKEAVTDNKFADRFRVQLANKPAKTITSHISKDGHYYIHPDPCQCRSLTVREAARIQTFPDNYFFCGPRTSQYIQVGNAVPPLLARQIAEIVYKIIQQLK